MTKTWFKAAGIRALKTVCQTAVATIGTAFVLSDVDFLAVASASVLAGVISLLTSLAGLPEVDGTGEEPSDQEDETVEEPSDEETDETEEEEEITSEE